MIAVNRVAKRTRTFVVDLGELMPKTGTLRVELHVDGQKLLQCRKCGRWLVPDEFYFLTNQKSRNGRASECVRCDTHRRGKVRDRQKATRGMAPTPPATEVVAGRA